MLNRVLNDAAHDISQLVPSPPQLLSAPEVLALAESFQSHARWALVSNRFLGVLKDCIVVRATATSAAAAAAAAAGNTTDATQPSTSNVHDDGDEVLTSALQKLYALAILTTITRALVVNKNTYVGNGKNDSGTDDVLQGITPPPEVSLSDETNEEKHSALEESALTLRHQAGNGKHPHPDSESVSDYEDVGALHVPLPPQAAAPQPATTTSPTTSHRLIHLSSLLSFPLVSSSGAWQDGDLTIAAQECLVAVRSHPEYSNLLPVVGTVAALLLGRIQSNPASLESGMDALITGLQLESGGTDVQSKALGLEVAASLSSALPPGPSRRLLWRQTQDVWLPIATEILENSEKKKHTYRMTQNQASEVHEQQQQQQRVVVVSARIIEFYVVDATSMKNENVKNSLIHSSGCFRGLALACMQYPDDIGLKRALVVVCAVDPEGMVAWLRAVPGFMSVWESTSSDLYKALLGVQEYGDQDANVAAALSSVLGSEGEGGGVERVAERIEDVYAALQVIESVHVIRNRRVGGSRRGIEGQSKATSLVGPRTDALLVALSATLRQLNSSGVDEDWGRGGGGEQQEEEEGDGRDARKILRYSAEQHAAQLTQRRARLLQPECLKIIKGLRAKPGSSGKSD